jgi:LmbE family N-acetylglucosaminyl deacetylase
MKRIVLTAIAVAMATLSPTAQHRLQPVSALGGEPALELMLRKLDTVGNFMMTTAHPDDENNAMLAYFSHGKGFRTSLVTATRGEGGQNEIGPELFEALAVLRTEELLAAHRFDGAEQYFTRAVDFGYSFSIEESLAKWGKQEILGDYVRMIRTIRPDVIVGFVFDGAGGGQHHQTSAHLTAEAFRAAADPAQFSDQIQKEGLRPWQAKKFYYTAGGPGGGGRGAPPATTGVRPPLAFTGGDEFDTLLGRTYNEIGAEGRSMHKCQGMSQLLPFPSGGGAGIRAYRLHDTTLGGGPNRNERDVFDGIDTSLGSLSALAGKDPPVELTVLLDRIVASVAEARRVLETGGNSATIPSLARGLAAVRELRSKLGSWSLGDTVRFEIDHRMKLKESQFNQALITAADVQLAAIAADGLVPRGGSVVVNLAAAAFSSTPVSLRASVNGFASGQPSTPCATANPLKGRAGLTCSGTFTVPSDTPFTAAHFEYATDAARFVVDHDVPPGLPFRPTPFTATFTLSAADVEASVTVPVQFRSEADLFSGEKRHEIHVVPKFAVTVTPDIAIVPLAATAGREVRVTVTNHSREAATATVELQVPPGWRATRPTEPVTFTREDEQMTVRFTLTPPAGIKRGRATVKAVVREGAATFDRGYQVVEYPHTTRRHVLRDPEVVLNAIDVSVKPNLTVGYVMGVGDEIPQALEQIGAQVVQLSADDLAWGDLMRFDVIMTGVRAYERRADLRASNQRLIDYARAGGTVIVNYNKFEFNEAQYGPYPGKVGRDRVTEETAIVRHLQPQHAVFTTPNLVGESDWRNWVQERGLYFFDTGTADKQYVDLLELEDPFPYNKGPKRGALVEAKVGQGRWIYIGLGLWRQLPAGSDGAFRLMANLISLGSAPKPRGGLR